MKKALKITGKILLGLLILLLAFLLIMFIYHRIKLKSEESVLEGYPGQRVTVDGHTMNVFTAGGTSSGNEGEPALVFLPASAETSPVYSFEPLYRELSKECSCAVPEKFGYGISDTVDGERDFDTIVGQYRTALAAAGVRAPYILCPYSLSGLEALRWAQLYPDEIAGIVGIDMAFPESYRNTNVDLSGKARLIGAARATGLIRLFVNEGALSDSKSPEAKRMTVALGCRNFINKCNVAEGRAIPEAVGRIEGASMPDIPMRLFLTNGSGTGCGKEDWQGFARSFTEGMSEVSFTELDCGHGEIVNKQAEALIKGIRDFVNDLR